MSGIDWKRYTQLCEESYTQAIERFALSLRRAAGVATCLSMPVYTGTMTANLVTVLRQMTDILKQLAQKQLTEKEQHSICWRDVEERMREVWFGRLSGIDNLPLAADYVNTRIHNRRSDSDALYMWISTLQSDYSEIERIVGRIREETALFTSEDVPLIMEAAQLGIRKRSQ